MPELPGPAYRYRDDPAVPAFDDTHPLFVFDGTCVLCSGGASFLMRRDRAGLVRFTPVTSPLGQALYRHYGVDWNRSYLIVDQGRAFTASAGYLHLARRLGGWWRLFLVGHLIPAFVRDAAYALVARNRYRWFGRADHCALLTPEQRARLI